MSTANQDIQGLNPQDPYSWIPDRINQEVQASLQNLENREDPLQEVTNAVKEEQSKPQEEFINKIKRLREEADEKKRSNELHKEALKENEERNKGFTAEKMSSNYLQFVKDQEKLSEEGKKENDEQLLLRTVKLHEDELREKRKQIEDLLAKIAELEKRLESKEKEGKIEEVQPIVEDEKQADTEIPQKDSTVWVDEQGNVISDEQEKTDEVPILDKLKEDPNVSQWEYEYPEERKEQTTQLKQPYTLGNEGGIVSPEETQVTPEEVPPVLETTSEEVIPPMVESKEEETPLNERTQHIVSLLVKALGNDTQIELATSSIIVTLKIEQRDIPSNVKALTDIAITIVRPQQTNLSEQ